MSSMAAEKQFAENVRLFGNAKSNPEKYNLYMGLANLAKAIRNLEYDLDELKRRVSRRG